MHGAQTINQKTTQNKNNQSVIKCQTRNVTPHFSKNTLLHPPANPPSKGVRGMSLPQNKTLLISKIKTIPRIKVQDKKNPLRLRLREQFPPKKWGAWGAKSDNKNHNENHKSFIIK